MVFGSAPARHLCSFRFYGFCPAFENVIQEGIGVALLRVTGTAYSPAGLIGNLLSDAFEVGWIECLHRNIGAVSNTERWDFSACDEIADTVFTKPQFGLLFSEFTHRSFQGAQMRSEPAVTEHQPVAQASLDPIIIHDMPISVHFIGKNAVFNQS